MGPYQRYTSLFYQLSLNLLYLWASLLVINRSFSRLAERENLQLCNQLSVNHYWVKVKLQKNKQTNKQAI